MTDKVEAVWKVNNGRFDDGIPERNSTDFVSRVGPRLRQIMLEKELTNQDIFEVHCRDCGKPHNNPGKRCSACEDVIMQRKREERRKLLLENS